MNRVRVTGIEVDRCENCAGIWFDLGELETLAVADDAETIDTGDASIGEMYNVLTTIECPKCQTEMNPVADALQSHIHYEVCPECAGVFLDAGEFKDFVFKEENLAALRRAVRNRAS